MLDILALTNIHRFRLGFVLQGVTRQGLTQSGEVGLAELICEGI